MLYSEVNAMQLILVSGLSGSGKSIAIRQLEDLGYYCIDNLPADFLVPVVDNLAKSGSRMAAVAIDARSHATFESIRVAAQRLTELGHDVHMLFLTASSEELIQRFSETRRRHPLSGHDDVTLAEAVEKEREMLAPAIDIAHVIDTTGIQPALLRRWVMDFVGHSSADMTLAFESFGFKHGVPVAADLVFDVRCLPNPYYDPALRPLTGCDKPVADFLAAEPLVGRMVDDIERFIRTWLPHYRAQNRHYLTVAIGCTGGQHRSVYVAENLKARFADVEGVMMRHRVLERTGLNRKQTL